MHLMPSLQWGSGMSFGSSAGWLTSQGERADLVLTVLDAHCPLFFISFIRVYR